MDDLLVYSVDKKIPVVLCTTGLSEEQMEQVKAASGQVAVLKSANMSLGINLLMQLLAQAATILAPAGFDMGDRGRSITTRAGCTERHSAGAGGLHE